MQYIQLQGQDAQGLDTPINGAYNLFVDTTDNTIKIKDENGNLIGGGAGIVNTTYVDLLELAFGGGLSAGQHYLISDYQTFYDQPDFDVQQNPITGSYKSGSVEPLVVLAISTSSLSPNAYSTLFPKDTIKYDIQINRTEATSGSAMGLIYERKDERGNRTDYDWRAVQFKRYDAFYCEQVGQGTLTIAINPEINTSASIVGVGTNFDNNFSVGDILGVKNDGIKIGGFDFYEIAYVSGSTYMEITGSYISERSNVRYGESVQVSTGFNPFQNNLVSRNKTEYEYYTFDNIDEYWVNNHLGDNFYNGDETFRLSNNVFRGGSYRNNYFGRFVIGNTFDDTNHDNKIGGNFQYNIITNDFDDNTIGEDFQYNHIKCDFQENIIGNNFSYNMFADYEGDDFENNVITGGSFYNNWYMCDNDFSYNFIYDSFNNNIIERGFQNNTITGDFNQNYLRNNFYNNSVKEFYGNKLLGVFERNTIGDSANNNTFSSSFEDNNVGYYFYNNTFGNESINSNNIGTYFENNIILDEFQNNTIGNNSYDNIFSSSFYQNSVGNDFYDNTFGDYDVRDNRICNDFYNNQILCDFNNNTIGNEFFDNTIANVFRDNTIGNVFENNTIGDVEDIDGYNFKNNVFGNEHKGNLFLENFESNTFKDNSASNEFNGYTEGNTFGSYAYNNTIGGSCEGNKIGNSFYDNEIGNDFENNQIGNNFYNNNISNFFSFNVIGDRFNNNTIADDFGFGGDETRGNRIGNYFQYNTIGEYFYENQITDLFENNIVGDYFQLNNVSAYNVDGVDFTPLYGNINTIDTIANPNVGGIDGVYPLIETTTNGQGVNATFDVTVTEGTASVAIVNVGKLYNEGDLLYITSSLIGSGSNLELSVSSLNATPVVYTQANSNIIRNYENDLKLTYIGTSFGIVGITESFD